ncbi:MAG: M56 family metallopeptidase [Ruminococcaceae bacterium]|nr:M56 family metallopeptidase [Oscillospiraceae bacterium]
MMNEWILSSSILIGAVLLGRLLLRGRISLRLQYGLWLVVLLRLLLPVQIFTSDFGAGSVAQEVDISAPVRQVYTAARSDDYQIEYDAAYQQVVLEYEARNQTIAPDDIDKIAYTRVQQSRELDLTKLLRGLWLAGMVVMTSVIAFCNVHLGLRLKRRRWEVSAADSLLPVYVTEVVPTPCIFGLFRPAIYLTPEAAKDEQVRSHVLAHELTHYRHLDHIWSVLRSVCLVLHWYNPLVWIAARVSRADAELACDEGALARLGEEHRADYGRTLIGLTCADHGGSMFVTATTMTGSAGSIRERIKLLMARPRNTILTLTAVILIGALIVGCTFSTAPETTEPTESTAPGVDNDMSYHGEELPIPEDPGAAFGSVPYFHELLNPRLERSEADWFPRALTSYYDDPAKIDLFQLFYTGIPGADNTPSTAELAFLENKPGYEPEFDLVRIPTAEMNRVLREYFGITLSETEGIGLEKFLYNEQTDCYYQSLTDTNLGFREVTAAEELEDGLWHVIYTDERDDHGVVTLRRYDGGWRILSNQQLITMPLSDPAEQERMLSLFEDPLVLDGLTYLWGSWEGFSLSGKTKSFVPEILDFQDTTQPGATVASANVYYRRPGSSQIYAAQMLRSGGEWELCGNRLVVSMGDYADRSPRPLTQEEQEQVNAAFDPFADEARAAACIVNSYYTDVTELDVGALLYNFPTAEEATQKEFTALREKYGKDFLFTEFENISDMPVPVHRYRVADIDAALHRYAGIGHDDLTGRSLDQPVLYLEETDSYYNFTSDFGLLGFHCNGGWVYDGGAVLFSTHSALYLTERGGNYHIQAHLPALMMAMPSSMPMIPAELSDEDAIAETLDAFFLAYEENINLNADHSYDHLTILAADPERTVRYQGTTVPISDFHGNIEYLHGKEAYWKHVCKDAGILPDTFQVTSRIIEMICDGDTAYVVAHDHMTFYYEGLGAPSGMGADFEILMFRLDGEWLIADVFERNDWFDADYKDDPNFDPDALIASVIP